MLLLSLLFIIVSVLLMYALMRDTGKNTPYARNKNAKQLNRRQTQSSGRSTQVNADAEIVSLS